MPTRLPSLTLVRFWAALLLAVIGMQASVPAAPSVQKTHGSAFAAATYDVALYIQRGERVPRQAVAPQPLAPVAVLAEALRKAVPPLGDKPLPRPDSTGPPLGDIHAWQPAPRAPPRA